MKHDRPGILAMACAKRNKNGCQFYVTQCVLDSLDGKRVGFGRGHRRHEADEDDRPRGDGRVPATETADQDRIVRDVDAHAERSEAPGRRRTTSRSATK